MKTIDADELMKALNFRARQWAEDSSDPYGHNYAISLALLSVSNAIADSLPKVDLPVPPKGLSV